MNAKNLFITAASIVGLGGLLTLVSMAMMYWIQQEVSAQLAKAGIVPASDVVALDTRIDGLESLHDKDTTRIEQKAETIARILMSDD